jgi:hypothetical protein
MTTIATDGRTIAADGLRCIGNERISLSTKKIRVVEGRIFAISGDFAVFGPAIEWYLAGADPKRVPSGEAGHDGGYGLYVIERDGRFYRYSDKFPYPDDIPYPATFGSGANYAMAALKCGKAPQEAVALAAELDVYTGGEIQVIDIATAVSQAERKQATVRRLVKDGG